MLKLPVVPYNIFFNNFLRYGIFLNTFTNYVLKLSALRKYVKLAAERTTRDCFKNEDVELSTIYGVRIY